MNTSTLTCNHSADSHCPNCRPTEWYAVTIYKSDGFPIDGKFMTSSRKFLSDFCDAFAPRPVYMTRFATESECREFLDSFPKSLTRLNPAA
jgi:hypothetical protein